MKKYFLSKRGVIRAALLSLAVLSLALGSCSEQPTPVATPSAKPIRSQPALATNSMPVNQKLVNANTRFGFKLFSQIQQQQTRKNIFISPASIAGAMAMTYNGAKDSTQQTMAKALELEGISLEEVNKGNAALLASLANADEKVQLAIANSLWLNEKASFLPDFIQRTQESYGAKLTQLNFSDASASSKINDWVKENTQSKIDKIVDRIDPQTILYLINAIYFKGTWTDPFSKEATKDRPFTLLDGTKKQIPLMSQMGHYRYYQNEKFQAVSLPYGTGRLSLYVFLPKAGVSLPTFYQNLTAENWDKWIKEFRAQRGSITLPRFKLEYDISLNDTLKALGMDVAFDPQRADFSGMTSAEDAHIDWVKHKTFVEVNEEGTEAAAVTGVGVAATSMPVDPPFNMVVDRPFFCAIRDNKTGTILFMGSIVDPK